MYIHTNTHTYASQHIPLHYIALHHCTSHCTHTLHSYRQTHTHTCNTILHTIPSVEHIGCMTYIHHIQCMQFQDLWLDCITLYAHIDVHTQQVRHWHVVCLAVCYVYLWTCNAGKVQTWLSKQCIMPLLICQNSGVPPGSRLRGSQLCREQWRFTVAFLSRSPVLLRASGFRWHAQDPAGEDPALAPGGEAESTKHEGPWFPCIVSYPGRNGKAELSWELTCFCCQGPFAVLHTLEACDDPGSGLMNAHDTVPVLSEGLSFHSHHSHHSTRNCRYLGIHCQPRKWVLAAMLKYSDCPGLLFHTHPALLQHETWRMSHESVDNP